MPELPFVVAGPVGLLELVLDVEQPHPGRGRHQRDGQLNREKRPHFDQPAQEPGNITIARFLVSAETQGSAPERVSPNGSRC